MSETPLPVRSQDCGDDELLVEVHACGINALDWFISGAIQRVPAFMRQDPGYVPGKDISGVVLAAGSRTTDFKPGDAIFGLTGLTLGVGMATQLAGDGTSRGGFASHTTIKAAVAAPKPANLTYVQVSLIAYRLSCIAAGLGTLGVVLVCLVAGVAKRCHWNADNGLLRVAWCFGRK